MIFKRYFCEKSPIMKILLKGSYAAGLGKTDILIENGCIAGIAPEIAEPAGCKVVDAGGLLVTEALADVHVHFRVPGRPDKETVLTGSRAAAAGGYTAVCTMPNLSPVPDSVENIAVEQEIIDKEAVVAVYPYAAITLGRAGKELVDMEALKGRCIAFSDDGSGVQSPEMMERAMRKAAELGCIIAAHCEDNSLLHRGYIHDGEYSHAHGHRGICSESEWGQIERDVAIAEKTGCRYHVCHISTKESVDIIRRAKARGVRVTCETGPHYLTLCDADLQEDGRFKMNPPLRSASDRDALIEGIVDGTIDMIATDHAPHTAEEKSRGLEGSAMGVVGLETAFPVLYTHLVRTGVISLAKLLELMSAAPRRIFGIGGSLSVGSRADIALFDLENEYEIDPGSFASKGRATPFAGWKVYGRPVMTIYNGTIVYDILDKNK